MRRSAPARTSSRCPSTASPQVSQAGAHQSRAAPGRLAARARGTRARATRCRRVRRVRGRRSPDRACLRGAPGAGGQGRQVWLRALPGVERVLDEAGKREMGLDHPRSGELVAIARADSWFTYYHFLDDARAPDYRAHGGHPPQAGLRPGGAVHRSGAAACQAAHRTAAGAEDARHALSDGRDLAGRDAGQGFARPSDRPGGGRAAVHHVRRRNCLAKDRSPRPPSNACCSITCSRAAAAVREGGRHDPGASYSSNGSRAGCRRDASRMAEETARSDCAAAAATGICTCR